MPNFLFCLVMQKLALFFPLNPNGRLYLCMYVCWQACVRLKYFGWGEDLFICFRNYENQLCRNEQYNI